MARLSGSMLPALAAALGAALGAALVAALASGGALAQPVTPASAAAAAAAAVPTVAEIKANVSLSQQQDKFGNYAPGAGESQFLGGKGDATGDGTLRKANCAGNTTDPECFAIQTLQRARGKPAAWVPPNSPQLAGRDTVVADPKGTLGVDPAEVAGATAAVQCRTDSMATPEVREENHCVVSTPDVAQSCSLGVEVEVDPDYVYKCLVRTATNSSVACSVGQVVTVDSTTTYRCVERMRSAAPNTCTVNRVIEVDAKSKYVCVNQERTPVDAQCAVGSVVEVRADTGYQCVNQVRQATDTACTVGSVVEVRADANYQCVDQARTVANAACSVGQVVTIDPKFNYTCQNTPNTVTTHTCSRKLVTSCAQACEEHLRITARSLVAGDSVTVAGGEVRVSRPTATTAPLRFTLYLEGEITGPIVFQQTQSGTIWFDLAVDGVTQFAQQTGEVDITAATTVGVTRTIEIRPTYRSGLYPPRVTIRLPGRYCVPACTETWDDSSCAPYRSRL